MQKSRLAAYGQCGKVKCVADHDLSAESHGLSLDDVNVWDAFELFQSLLSKSVLSPDDSCTFLDQKRKSHLACASGAMSHTSAGSYTFLLLLLIHLAYY